ncbi:MAG: hypothetical protein ACRDOO_05430 [Actinomadura sp.]
MLRRYGGELTSIKDRLTRLERLVGAETRPGSMTIISRLDAQHELLQALQRTQSEHTATFARHTEILNEHSAMFGKLLYGMTEIKSLLKPDDDSGRGG